MLNTENTNPSDLDSYIEKKADTDSWKADLAEVKKISDKLQLAFKRQSILQWKMIVEEKKKNGLLGNSTPIHPSPSLEVALSTEEGGSFVNNNNSLSQNTTAFEDIRISPSSPTAARQVAHHSSNADGDVTSSRAAFKTHEILSIRMKQDEDSGSNTEKTGVGCGAVEKFRRISESLTSVRKELMLMRLEDHKIARKLLNIRENINRQRARLTCEEHAQFLDCVSWEIEEEKELNEMYKVSDLSGALLRRPDSLLRSPSLLHNMRINKTTFDFKRFSVI